MSKSRSNFRNRQLVKDEQINYLLGDLERNLEDYRQALELKEKQLSDAKKILLSAKQSYDKTVAENRDLKAYKENLKQRFQSQQQQQLQFLEKQKYYYQQKKPTPKKYKKVIFKEEDESDPELEQEEDEESENEEIEQEPEMKRVRSKRKEPSGSNIFEYINKNAKRHK